MKILVVGLDCAAPELLLGMDDLPVIRHLMATGCYGRLESVVPPITVPAWMSMATSRDPGALGVYGFRNRRDHGYGSMATVNRDAFDVPTLWDRIAMEGGRSVIVGVPPSVPPRRMNGASVGCFLTPDTTAGVFTHPAELSDRIREWVGAYPVDVRDFRTDDKGRLHREILAMTATHFEVVRRLIREETWDYFQFVEIGLDRIHHGFWRHHDPNHRKHDPDSPWREVVRDYYRLLDREIGSVLELVDDDTAVLVVSDHGARPIDGGFCVNEWLVREGDLVLHARPHEPTPFPRLDVDWSATRAWGAGGYYARIFLNVEGREPQGAIPAADYEAVRSDLKARLEATTDPDGRVLGTRAWRPEDLYSEVRGIAPDLIVHFGDLAWRSVGGVGHDSIWVEENDTGPDDCNHAQYGAFVLAAPGLPPGGEREGVHILDIAPTLLALGGWQVPPDLQGRPFVGRVEAHGPDDAEGDAEVRRRLEGLGYIA